MKNIVIIGQGAMGLLWYSNGQLTPMKSTTAVTLRASRHDYFTHDKITLIDYQQQQHQLTLSPATDSIIAQADYLICCVKSFQVANVITQLAPLAKTSASWLLLHNGLGVYEQIAPLLPNRTIIGLLTTHGAFKPDNYTIHHTGLGETQLGVLQQGNQAEQLDTLIASLNHILPPVIFNQHFKQAQWLKLAVNAVINPITAINDIDNGEINQPGYQSIIQEILLEFQNVAAANQLNFSLDNLKQLVSQVAHNTQKNCSSMRADIRNNRPTEIDFINGFICQQAQKHQIATPVNQQLTERIHQLTSAR